MPVITYMLKNLELAHPGVFKDMEEFQREGPDNLIIKTKSGAYYLYDNMTESIMCLPDDPDNMSESEYRREFSRRLKRVMYYKNISQKELSELINISEQTISKYINCQATPSFYNVDKIARALGVSVDEFRFIF